MTDAQDTGRLGEDIASRYLKKNFYRVMNRNVRCGRDEIDIIAYDHMERMLVFIEVKTRTKNDARYPIRTAVDERKRRCLMRALHYWCNEKNYDGPARIDILCVHDGEVIEHIKELGSNFLHE